MTIERIGVAEAKRRFSELAERVGRGESFVIMSRGRSVVALVPPQRVADEEPSPSIGLAAFAGVLAGEWDTVDEDIEGAARLPLCCPSDLPRHDAAGRPVLV
jgi:prevent-host-death family protein